MNLGQFNPALNPLNLIPNITFGGGATSAGNFGISNDPQINFYTRFPFNNNTGTWEYTDGLTKVWNKHHHEVRCLLAKRPIRATPYRQSVQRYFFV